MEKNVTCPQCGATMTRQGDTPQFECPYCGEQKFIFNEKKEAPKPKPEPRPEPEVKYVYVERESKPEFHSAYGEPNFKYSNKGQNQNNQPRKSKSTALLLCFFLGTIGIHQFYLGHIFKGILYVVLAVIFFPIPAVLSFLDFLTYLFRDEKDF